ncbi:MAG TPA: hypothetical protein VK901_20210, partial [Nitrospiraceae bacterium]|nr:hypothetical protein [Nitrospiraceae bacterium]
KKDLATSIDPISQSDKPQVIFELLGGSPTDLLFPNNFLIVEGRSEFALLTRIIRRHYADKPRLQIIFAMGDSTQQARSMNLINIAFTPPNQTPVYRKCLILLCDKPNPVREEDFKNFREKYPELKDGDQIFVLDTESIEESYPPPWKKTAAEVKVMTGKGKVELASTVGDNITKEQFQEVMPKVFGALQKAWEKAYR